MAVQDSSIDQKECHMTNTTVTHVWEDRFGSVIDFADAGFLEIRWYDTTKDMTAAQFQEWLTGFADAVERFGRPGILVDATSFQMDPANVNMEWRDEHITPHYEAGGVKKFAFHMPDGMPAIGASPEPEGPASFPTGYFGRRQDALNWLGSA
jgi:hypothetical protein